MERLIANLFQAVLCLINWEYMWVCYADAEDAAAKAIVKKPVEVYIEKVFEQGDFGPLGIGT